ncbi:Cytochrome c family protein [Georgfuchsia toluolica]|uniref:Cytochrome c family protein n=2 Tax=Georgfuchsia toluolica TaxID=424218 RepID=A0A916N0R5_9PROT|nr:Cytochrome c family protein [Georgfuchsia toluolica]
MLSCNFKKLALAGAIAGILLAGCGSGGGGAATPAASTTLSGTVAGGAAVIGTVLITDSKGATKGATIEANGHYSIDVSGMTGPFVLKAAGTVGNTSVTYYSAATTADVGGTVNVTPFTDLMVSNIAAQMAETYFSDPANIAKIGDLITADKLAAAQSALHAKLEPVLTTMGISDSIDLLRTSFAADHSGMDAVLDLVKVETDTATNIVTLKNALTQAVIATDNAATSTDDATPVDSTKLSGMNAEGVTDLQAVIAKLDGFAALFATSLPSMTTLQNSGVFDTSSNFMMDGQTFAQFASELSTDPDAIGLKFSNVAITLDPGSITGTLTADITSNNPATFTEKIQLKMAKVNGLWLVQGDGRIADVSITAQAQRDEWTSMNTMGGGTTQGSSMTNGLWMNIDPHSYNTNNPGALAVKAVVTGPGLPAGGVTMVQDIQNTWFDVELPNYNNNVIPECGSTVNGTQGPFVANTQCVIIAQALDNSVYTAILKDSNGNSLNGSGYTLTLPKQPYITSTLSAAAFPSITAITIDGVDITPSMMQNAVAAGGKSANVTWTMPTGLMSEHLDLWANTTTGASYIHVEKDLLSTATSALMGLGTALTTGTVTNAGIWLSGVDAYGRRLAVSKSVSTQ